MVGTWLVRDCIINFSFGADARRRHLGRCCWYLPSVDLNNNSLSGGIIIIQLHPILQQQQQPPPMMMVVGVVVDANQ